MIEQTFESVLEQTGGGYFICGRVHFVVAAEVRDEVFHWAFYFQNRDSRDVVLTLAVEVLSTELVGHAELICPAGQSGVKRLPWRVPEDCRHERQVCQFIAITDYGEALSVSGKGYPPVHTRPSATSLAVRILQEARVPAKASQMARHALGPIDIRGRDVMNGPAWIQVDFAKGVVDLLTVDEDTQPLPAFVQIAGLAFMVTVAIGAIVVMVRAVMLM